MKRFMQEKKAFECKQCGKCFIHAGKLRVHEKGHTAENPLECSVATVIAKQENQGYMKAFTLRKSSLNENSVASVLTLQEA